jgi:hypothetical protein
VVSVKVDVKAPPSSLVRAAWTAGLAVTLTAALGCTSPAERQAAENARVEKQAAKEINRICALPDAQRDAELKRIKEQSGMVLYCGSK